MTVALLLPRGGGPDAIPTLSRRDRRASNNPLTDADTLVCLNFSSRQTISSCPAIHRSQLFANIRTKPALSSCSAWENARAWDGGFPASEASTSYCCPAYCCALSDASFGY